MVVFGGRQMEGRVNELHILNMQNWVSNILLKLTSVAPSQLSDLPQHWSGAIIASSPNEPWPSSRSFHVACSLVDPACVKCPTIQHHPGKINILTLTCDVLQDTHLLMCVLLSLTQVWRIWNGSPVSLLISLLPLRSVVKSRACLYSGG